VDLGTFYDIARRHDPSEQIEFEVRWQLDEPIRVLDPARRSAEALASNKLRFSLAVDQVGDGDAAVISVKKMEYELGQAVFPLVGQKDDPERYDLEAGGFPLRRRPGRPWPLPSPIKSYGFPDQVANYYQNADFLSDLALAFDQLMSNISYVGPLRE